NLAAERLTFPGVFCMPGISLEPEFNAISPVEPNEIVGFDAGDSIITLNAGVHYVAGKPEPTYAKMKWNFGDGTETEGYAPGSPKCEAPWLTECAESVYHTYTKPGTYTVTLTVKDVGGNVDSVSHEITVVGTPEEAVVTPPASSTSSPSGSSPSVVTSPPPVPGGTTASGATVPLPVATAYVLSHSLKTALSKGVAVRYQVNEQVAGHFEVLLGQKTAKHLKIHGSMATGLPAGSEPEVIIGTALVVTLKGGGSTTHVILTKSATSHLRHVKKLPLSLRLTVRNAAVHDPATAVVVSAFTLKV
ncbi:MAG TPA: PKD domain-containing protein, partial [Solirubrobacteraceae bacterium]|nr:PKD domain-containing protein [Solirubrobacteraceae bacterium]